MEEQAHLNDMRYHRLEEQVAEREKRNVEEKSGGEGAGEEETRERSNQGVAAGVNWGLYRIRTIDSTQS